MFKRSSYEIEKCWKFSRRANIILFKDVPVVPCLENSCFIRFNNSLASSIKSLRQKVKLVILKNSPLIAE